MRQEYAAVPEDLTDDPGIIANWEEANAACLEYMYFYQHRSGEGVIIKSYASMLVNWHILRASEDKFELTPAQVENAIRLFYNALKKLAYDTRHIKNLDVICYIATELFRFKDLEPRLTMGSTSISIDKEVELIFMIRRCSNHSSRAINYENLFVDLRYFLLVSSRMPAAEKNNIPIARLREIDHNHKMLLALSGEKRSILNYSLVFTLAFATLYTWLNQSLKSIEESSDANSFESRYLNALQWLLIMTHSIFLVVATTKLFKKNSLQTVPPQVLPEWLKKRVAEDNFNNRYNPAHFSTVRSLRVNVSPSVARQVQLPMP